jgi:serine/threonine protein kinase
MPFGSGGSIKWLLQKFNKFSGHLALLFMKQILEGLHFLHQNQLFHMNLKSTNVLVDEDALVKLSDINFQSQHKISFYSPPEV